MLCWGKLDSGSVVSSVCCVNVKSAGVAVAACRASRRQASNKQVSVFHPHLHLHGQLNTIALHDMLSTRQSSKLFRVLLAHTSTLRSGISEQY